MLSIIFDIETAPIPREYWNQPMIERYKKILDKNRRWYEGKRSDEEIKRLTASLDPMTSFICCISAQSVNGNKRGNMVSYKGYYPEEKTTLTKFWSMVGKAPDDAIWVSFCGKFFDIPHITARSLKHNVKVTNPHLTASRSPYSHAPHFDMQSVFGRDWRLVEACELMGIESPKGDIDGSQVADLVASEQLDKVVEYCEGDVDACVKMYMKLRWSYAIFPYRRPAKKKPQANQPRNRGNR